MPLLFSKSLKDRLKSFFKKKNKWQEKLDVFLGLNFNIKSSKFDLYQKALTHKSISLKHNNERLEFLGDAILDAVVSGYILSKFPGENEGQLTKLKSRVVNRTSLNQLAQKIELKSLLLFNPSGYNISILGNAFEALIGAIYLDKGYAKTKKALIYFLKKEINFDELNLLDSDFKSKLINWSQREKKKLKFIVVRESGIDHKKVYTVEVKIETEVLGSGTGKSKKSAEQLAANKALKKLNLI